VRKGASRIYYPGSSGIDRSLLIDIGFGHSSCILITSSKSQENRDGQGQNFHVESLVHHLKIPFGAFRRSLVLTIAGRRSPDISIDRSSCRPGPTRSTTIRTRRTFPTLAHRRFKLDLAPGTLSPARLYTRIRIRHVETRSPRPRNSTRSPSLPRIPAPRRPLHHQLLLQ